MGRTPGVTPHGRHAAGAARAVTQSGQSATALGPTLRFRCPSMAPKESTAARLARLGVTPETLAAASDASSLPKRQEETLKAHDRIMGRWKEFCDFQRISFVVTTGTPPPSEGAPQNCSPARTLVDPWIIAELMAFAHFLAWAVPGQLDERPSRCTVVSYIVLFATAWKRRVFTQVDSKVQENVRNYINSPKFHQLSPVSTLAREKPVAMPVDCELLVRQIWSDRNHFRTSRERIQAAGLVIVQSLTMERPGALVVSNSHRGSNEAILHSDVEVMVQPNPEDELGEPKVSMKVTFRLLKGYREDLSTYKSVIFYPEPPLTRFMCPFTAIISLQLLDGAFMDVSSIEEIVRPNLLPTQGHTLRLKEEWRQVPIFRRAVFDPAAGWITSPKHAVAYSTYLNWLRFFSHQAGFHGSSAASTTTPYSPRWIETVTSYCIRRSINAVAPNISAEDREQWMNHKGGSHLFVSRATSVRCQRCYPMVAGKRIQSQDAHC